ncbi:DnaA N-terminal domain-containing protein [Desertibacillus haloalkaliphilus]|uniref:DnaA N-terminal domain-containing protein n=1 Tax=Desertibacillus haloalkaliphilus TaxID=1328930 RepID=UPI001C26FCC2|nr:DnaA N-terminal domain-containing protein [Desertibacillus haloalkaliphilus]MBU8908740.1 hypothetical protein [Desertibacillus haloalkaliphilus]
MSDRKIDLADVIVELKEMQKDLREKESRITEILEQLEETSDQPVVVESKSDHSQLFYDVLNRVEAQISGPSFATWFSNLEGSFENDTLTITCNNLFQRDWVENRYRPMIEDSIKEITGGNDITVEIASLDDQGKFLASDHTLPSKKVDVEAKFDSLESKLDEVLSYLEETRGNK